MDELAEIKKLLAENRKELLEIKAEVHKISKHIAWTRVVEILRILIFVVPLIIGFVYLAPLLGQVMQGYRELLGQPGQTDTTVGSSDPELQNFLNNFNTK